MISFQKKSKNVDVFLERILTRLIFSSDNVFIVECDKPLGPYDVAIKNVLCDIDDSLGDECASRCQDVRLGEYAPTKGAFLCRGGDGIVMEFHFSQFTVVSGILMEAACDNCMMTKFVVRYKSPHTGPGREYYYNEVNFLISYTGFLK